MPNATKFGRYQVAEPLSALHRTHFYGGAPLKEVDFEPAVGVLDQEDLVAQGLLTSEFVPGCTTNLPALGSCTANTTIENVSNLVADDAAFAAACAVIGALGVTGFADVVGAEKAAILFYHQETSLTGSTSTEWPPTDCGSSGPYMAQMLLKLGLISGETVGAHTAEDLVSLMQTGNIAWGTPWFNAWMSPPSNAFLDGNGTTSAIEASIKSGLAGGHEITESAIEKLTLSATGKVESDKTVLRIRNHWTKSWGDNGSCYVHLSTWLALASHCDFRQFHAAA